jgi:glutaredoxin 3
VTYRDVETDRAAMADMTALTRGRRDVPVLLEDGKVTIGYGGS